MYLRPPSKNSVEESKIIAIFYTFLSPMLNPLIYSLRNKHVIHAMRHMIKVTFYFTEVQFRHLFIFKVSVITQGFLQGKAY